VKRSGRDAPVCPVHRCPPARRAWGCAARRQRGRAEERVLGLRGDLREGLRIIARIVEQARDREPSLGRVRRGADHREQIGARVVLAQLGVGEASAAEEERRIAGLLREALVELPAGECPIVAEDPGEIGGADGVGLGLGLGARGLW